jgi:hypothetical protein
MVREPLNRDARTRRGIAGASAACACAFASAAVADTIGSGGEDRYRCVVLGDTRACPPSTPKPLQRSEERLELGPYGKYLMYRGLSREQAARKAREEAGERPTLMVVQTRCRPLSGWEMHQRYLGERLQPPECVSTVVSARPH